VRLSWSGFQAGGQHVPWSHVKLKLKLKLKLSLRLSLNLSLHNLSLGLDRIRYELAHVHSIGLSRTNARRRDIGATTHDRFVSRRGTRQSNAGAIAACVHASINIADGGRAMPRPQGRNHRDRVFECEIDPRRFGSPLR
jgi:hypothetical protein